MEWEKELSTYLGCPIEVWIEDHSGEEQTKPKQYSSLFRIKISDDPKYLQFYLNPAQFLSVPIFDENLTKLVKSDGRYHFVSHDLKGKLTYWIFFGNSLVK